jgi:hypothetical protein
MMRLRGILPVAGLALALCRPGQAATATGASVLVRNGDLAVAQARAGFVLGDVLSGPGLGPAALVEGGLGLGGGNVGGGLGLVWNAGHPFAYNTLAVQAKVLRPWLLSPWPHEVHKGLEASLGIAIFHLTVGMYAPGLTDFSGTWRLQVGGGLRLLF